MRDQRPVILEVSMEMALPHPFLDDIARRFGPQKARDAAMSTSVGGIGPLLRERVMSQAEHDVDVIAVSLLYETVWAQAWQEWGQLNLQKRHVGAELRELLEPTELGFDLEFFDGTREHVRVWKIPNEKAAIYLLDAPAIADSVYPGPKDMPPGTTDPYAWSHTYRLKQSWLVGRGALILAKKLGRRPDIAILSETPTIFAHAKLVADPIQKDAFFDGTRFIFNDHTPLEYAHPIWDEPTLAAVKLDPAIYRASSAWNGQKKTLDVTALLVDRCEGVYGVARKHGDVMRKMPSLKHFGEKIRYVTNGVRRADWQAAAFGAHESMSDADLFAAKLKLKKAMLDWAWRRCRLWPTWAAGALNRHLVLWTRRITAYKRLDVLYRLASTPELRRRYIDANVVFFIGGRIHQQDNQAQDLVFNFLELLEKDRELADRILFIDNFNVWEAPILFQGTDASVMMADDTREASATGFMKAQMNGAAIIATEDGAVPEFVYFDDTSAGRTNGFSVPYVNGEPTPQGLIEAIERFSEAMGDKTRRAALMRSALAVTDGIDVDRAVAEMKELYRQVSSEPVKA